MSEAAPDPTVVAQAQEAAEQRDAGSTEAAAAPVQETGTKRPRSNSLEAAAAQALTQLDGPPHHRQQSMGGFQPTLGPPQPMHPTQYANAFSAGQNPGQQQQQEQQQHQQQQQPQQLQQQQSPEATFNTVQMNQSPAFRPNTGSPIAAGNGGQAIGSPAGGRAPGAHQARQRTAVACRYCRKRKIRCTGISHDSNDPRCSNCRRLDQECIYAPVGAPQGNYTRQPMPDAYGRGQPFHPMPQNMMQGHQQQWQGQPMGYPPQGPYMQYAQGRGVPGPDGQHQFPQGQGYMPGPGYPPQGQTYQYDNNYPTYVSDPATAQGHGQFGRLKPETYAVFASPTANQNVNSVIDPAVQQDIVPDVSEPVQGTTSLDAPQVQDLQQQPGQQQQQEQQEHQLQEQAQEAQPATSMVDEQAAGQDPPVATESSIPQQATDLSKSDEPTEQASEAPVQAADDAPNINEEKAQPEATGVPTEEQVQTDLAEDGEGTNQLPNVDDAQLSKLLGASEDQSAPQ